ncbi:MAG: ATP-binding protein [Acidimicrobiia bacterium]
MRRSPLDVDKIVTLGAALSRASNLGVGLIETSTSPRTKVARAYRAAWIALSIAGLVDIARRRRYRRRWIVTDAALAAAMNLAESTWDHDGDPMGPHFRQMATLWVSAAATADFAPVAVVSVVAACASWSWALVRLRRRRPELSVPVVAATLEPLITAGTIAVIARRLRAIEAEMEALRESARVDAETAAVELERERTHRLLHDTVLQTLEAVSGDWHADDASLRSLAASDARWLRRALSQSDADLPLESALADLVETYRQVGLDITLEPCRLPGCEASATEELVAATREAMVNVLKHAGPCSTMVTAECRDATVTVTVADDGAGFDTATDNPGYGIEHSIRGRLHAVGGDVVIDSRSGRGTVVRMSVPLRRVVVK